MNALLKLDTIPAFNAESFDDAVRMATMRANHSFFDQHVIEEEDGTYIAIDEGDYNALPQHLIDRIAHTVQGTMSDDLDDDTLVYSTLMNVSIDPDYDTDCPF